MIKKIDVYCFWYTALNESEIYHFEISKQERFYLLQQASFHPNKPYHLISNNSPFFNLNKALETVFTTIRGWELKYISEMPEYSLLSKQLNNSIYADKIKLILETIEARQLDSVILSIYGNVKKYQVKDVKLSDHGEAYQKQIAEFLRTNVQYLPDRILDINFEELMDEELNSFT